MENPAISVIVPVYKVELILKKCVDSIRGQTLKNIEIILVDDGSPDNCPAMCDAFKSEDERISVIHKKNAGVGYARNSGLEIAKGEFVYFIDSDDYIEPDMLETMYAAAKDADAEFVQAGYWRETAEGNIIEDNVFPLAEGIYNGDEVREKLLYPLIGRLPHETKKYYMPCGAWQNIYKKSTLDKYGLKFDSERDFISEDLLFNYEFYSVCQRAVIINRNFYHYIANDASMTQSYRADRFEMDLKLYHELGHRMKAAGIFDECDIRRQHLFLDRSRRFMKQELCMNPDHAQAKKNVRKMTACDEITEIYKAYPIWRMPWNYCAANFIIKHRLVGLLYILRNKL